MFERFTQLPRAIRRACLIVCDALGVLLALWLAYVIRFEQPWPAFAEWNIWLFPVAVAISIPVFMVLGFYRSLVRFVHGGTFYGIARGVSLSVLFMMAVPLITHPTPGVPRSIWFLYWLLAILILSAFRLVGRSYLRSRRSRYFTGERVVIYGAGDAGVQLAMALQHSREYRPVAFIDDSLDVRGSDILGLKVYGRDQLDRVIARHQVRTVLLAMPSITRSARKRVIEALEPFPVHVMAIPGLTEIVSGER